MKTKTIKILSVLMLAFCVFSLCSCGSSQGTVETDIEKVAEKNTKAIVGTWIVESVEKKEVESLSDIGASMTTNLLFGEKTEVQFLSNGTFTSSIYNLKYELVDNQFIYSYKDQTYAYDCEITGDTMILSTPGVITATLKKQ